MIPVLYHCWYQNVSTILVNKYKKIIFSFKSPKSMNKALGGGIFIAIARNWIPMPLQYFVIFIMPTEM
jgi:hypothetical protein